MSAAPRPARKVTTRIGNAGFRINRLREAVGDAEVLVDETVTDFLAFGKCVHWIVFIVDEQCRGWAGAKRICWESVFSGHGCCRIDEVRLRAGSVICYICSAVVADGEDFRGSYAPEGRKPAPAFRRRSARFLPTNSTSSHLRRRRRP
jgi:hypothetical protein